MIYQNYIIIIIFVLCPVSSMGLDGRWLFAIRLCSPLCPPQFPGPPYPPRCISSSSSLVFPPVFCLGRPSSSLSLWRYPPLFSWPNNLNLFLLNLLSMLRRKPSEASLHLVLRPAIWHQPCSSTSFCLLSWSSPTIRQSKAMFQSRTMELV